jgi:hypothetical protein
MEGVLAAFAQFDNDCRSDQTRAGMKAALELGRWTFLAPIGYLNASRATGKSLMADPERAPIVRRVFEEYATGRYTKEQLLKQARAWGLTNRRGRPLTSQVIGMLLRNQLNAGIVDVPEYGVRAKRGAVGQSTSRRRSWKGYSPTNSQTPSALPKRFKTNWTVWTRRSSSSVRSTSRRTTATPRNYARSSRSPGSTVTPANSMNST